MTEGMNEQEITGLLKPEDTWKGHSYQPGKFISPGVVVYLECSPKIAMGRIPREDKWEEVPFLDRLVSTYENLFENPPPVLRGASVVRINAEPDIRTVSAEIDQKVLPIFRDYSASGATHSVEGV